MSQRGRPLTQLTLRRRQDKSSVKARRILSLIKLVFTPSMASSGVIYLMGLVLREFLSAPSSYALIFFESRDVFARNGRLIISHAYAFIPSFQP